MITSLLQKQPARRLTMGVRGRGHLRLRVPSPCVRACGRGLTTPPLPLVPFPRPQRDGNTAFFKHKWFSSFNWKTMRDRSMKAPYVPELKGDLDLRYFTVRGRFSL